MNFVETVSVEEAATALGLQPAAIRLRIKDGRLPATLVGRRWRVLASGIHAVLGTPPEDRPAASPIASIGADGAEPVFTDEDFDNLTRAELMRHSLFPGERKLGAWILAKHQRFGGSRAVPCPAPSRGWSPTTQEKTLRWDARLVAT